MSEELVGECWLQSARVARKAGHHQTAFNALLNAENTHLAELVTEKAKWLWSKVLHSQTLNQANMRSQMSSENTYTCDQCPFCDLISCICFYKTYLTVI